MNPLGSSKEVVENRLIILYLLDKLDLPVSNLQILKLILGNKLMNYFHLQQDLNDLLERGYLEVSSAEGRASYVISQPGKHVLQLLSGHLPAGMKKNLDRLASSVRKDIRNEIYITADFTPESENEYMASLKAGEENFTLMKIDVMCGTKNDARTICENWKRFSQDIYAEIIEALTKKRD